MPLPTPAIGASLIGVFSTIANACEIVSARSPADRGRMRHDRTMIPSAASPTRSSGWREFLRVMRLRSASTAAIAPRPAIQSAGTSGTPRIDTSPQDLLRLAFLPVGLAELNAAAFLHVVARVHRQLADDVAFDDGLAAEARLRRQIPRGVEPIGLVVFHDAQVVRAFPDDDVTS